MFISVDLPLPDGPHTARNSPAWMSSEMLFSASMVVSPSRKRRLMLRSFRIGGWLVLSLMIDLNVDEWIW